MLNASKGGEKLELKIHSNLKAAIANTKHGTLPKTTVLIRNLENNNFLNIYIPRILKAHQTGKIIEQLFYDSIRPKILCFQSVPAKKY